MVTRLKIGKVYYARHWEGKGRKNRKRKYIRLSTDSKIANEKIVEIEKELEAKKYGHTVIGKSWESFKEKYSNHSKTEKKSTTREFDEYILDIFENDNTISFVKELTPSLLDEWKSKLHSRGLKPASINRYLGLLKAMGAKAYEWGYVPENRYLTVKPMRIIETEETEKTIYTTKQIKAIQKACVTEYERVLIDIAFYSGLRRAEIQNLKWKDIDLENNTIHIQATKEWSPKSYKPRYIELNLKLKKTLLKWKKKSKGDYVLPSNLKNIWFLSKLFKKILKRIGLKGSIHDARHTLITHLAEAGEDPLVLQREAGHSDFKTTNKTYTHLDIRKAKTKINKLPY